MTTPVFQLVTPTLLAGHTSVVVSLTLPSTNFRVVVDTGYKSGPVWITGKSTTGFTVYVNNAPAVNTVLRCEIYREW